MTPQRLSELKQLAMPIETHFDGGRLKECLDEIERLQVEIERLTKERDDANRIKSAEKQILIAEIEAHTKAKAELDGLHAKDSVRTKEHNVLVQENRSLQAENERLKAAFGPTMVLLEVMKDSAMYSNAVQGELARLRAVLEKGTE